MTDSAGSNGKPLADTLVLGGGGLSGIAWMTGLLAGLADEGADLCSVGRVIGTSAGSTVGAQLRSGLPLADLFARQTEAALQVQEIALPFSQLFALFEAFKSCAGMIDAAERGRHMGRIALDAKTVSEADRRAVIADRLPVHDWPARRLEVSAIDAETGAFRLFDAAAGAALVEAVAASCAVPGVWPAVTIAGRRYIDGGLRTADNADLAAGDGSAVILSPIGGLAADGGTSSLSREIAVLEAAGTRALAIQPDAQARAAMGMNALDPAVRAPAAQAGRVQGRREAAQLLAWAGHLPA